MKDRFILGKENKKTLTIDKELIQKAHELGLNVSKIAENALKEAINRLQTPVQQTETNGGYIDTRKRVSSARLAGPGVLAPNWVLVS